MLKISFNIDELDSIKRKKFIKESKKLFLSIFGKKHKKVFIELEKVKKPIKKPLKKPLKKPEKIISLKNRKIKYIVKKFNKGVVVKGKSYFQVSAKVTFRKKTGKTETVEVFSYSHKKRKKKITENEILEYLQEGMDTVIGLYSPERERQKIIRISNINVIRWIKK